MEHKHLFLPLLLLAGFSMLISCSNPIIDDSSSSEESSSEEGSSTSETSESISGQTFYLYWNLDGGVTESEYTHGEIEVGTPIVAPTNVKKDGFSFAGWDKEVPEIMMARNLTITAKWISGNAINYFDKGGTSFTGVHEEGYPQSFNERVYLKKASKDGYSFSGWHLDKDCLDEPIFNIDPALFSGNQVNLYTDWKRFGGNNVYKAQKIDNEATITIDGYKDEAYANSTPIAINTKVSGSPAATATAYITWKESDIYIFIDVIDPTNYLYWDGDVENYDRVKLFVDLLHNVNTSSSTPGWGSGYRGDNTMCEGWYTIARGGPQYNEESNPRYGSNSIFEWGGWMSNAAKDSGYTVGTSRTHETGYCVEYHLDCSFDDRIPNLVANNEIGIGICVLDKISDDSAGNMVCMESNNRNSVTSPAYLSNVRLVESSSDTAPSLDTQINGWYEKGGSMVSQGVNDIALLKDQNLASGTFQATMSANGIYDSGLIFNANDDASEYYYIYTNSVDGNQFKLLKHKDNTDTELGSCYLTGGHNPEANIPIKVVFNNGDIKCFYEGKLLIARVDSSPLTGNRIGFLSKNVHGRYCDIYTSTEEEFSEVETLIIGHSYMELWTNYKEDLSKYTDIMNIGIGGTSTNDWKGHFNEVKAYNPKRLIYVIGINDFPWGTLPATILANVQELMSQVLSDLPDTETCIVSVNKACDTSWCKYYTNYKDRINEYNALLRTYVEGTDHLYYGDIDNAFLDANGVPDPGYFVDGLHPTKEAYLTIRDAIYNALSAVD